MAIKPESTCPYCHGTGVVTDWVDYGSTHVPMESECDCAYEDESDEEMRKLIGGADINVWYVPGNAPFYYCVYRHGFMIGEWATENEALADFSRATNFTWEG